MMRAAGIVGIGLLALSFPQQADASTVKQRQRAACGGMRPGDVSRRVPKRASCCPLYRGIWLVRDVTMYLL